MKQRAFSLIEIMAVLGIIVVVASITYPVFQRAKRSALETASVQNMHQLQMAIEIYRQDWSTSLWGNVYDMGLPYESPWDPNLKKQFDLLGPPMRPRAWYMYFPCADPADHRVPTWTEHTLEFHDQTILLADMWFNPQSTNDVYKEYWMNPDYKKYGLGIMLAGNLVRKTNYGNIELEWWD